MQRLVQSDFSVLPKRGGKSFELTFAADASSGLPLLSGADEILKVVLTYLALPHSVTEFGCGKKASLILRLLFERGIPAYALSRGMILERDLSQEALDTTDPKRRPHALTAANPLFRRADLSNPTLLHLLGEAGVKVEAEGSQLRAGDFLLQHRSRIQFAHARSHVFPCLTLWDEANQRAVWRAIDPTIHKEGIFPVENMRRQLGASEAWLLSAALLGRFYLVPELLTPKQSAAIAKELPDDRPLEELPWEEQAKPLKRLSQAPDDTVGDPWTWTYANNLPPVGTQQHRRQVEITGRGDGLGRAARQIVDAREAFCEARLETALEKARESVSRFDLKNVLVADAQWSEQQLRPLADLANSVSYHRSLETLAKRVAEGRDPVGEIHKASARAKLHGIGVRLRGRIDTLAQLSTDAEGRIDARALNDRFIAAACEVIRQMNRAGLTVFLDKVGNIHGLQLRKEEREAIRDGSRTIADFAKGSLCHGSHIDTVFDAGKYDGRLGVLSGIEIASALHDLDRFYDVAPAETQGATRRLLVTAFLGEEMNFTGREISMPGSSAVVGAAAPEDVHEMLNADSERFGDRLVKLIDAANRRCAKDELRLAQPFEATGDRGMIDDCPDPRQFYTPRLVERHLEQGSQLDRSGVPLVLAERIMGIRQDDFFVEADAAEAVGLQFICLLRRLNWEKRFRGLRLTVGVFQPERESLRRVSPTFGLRWQIAGQSDHAGATPVEDRSDAGVAGGMLACHFLDSFEAESSEARPVLGSVRLGSGENRNVIPGLVELSLGVEGPFSEREQTDLLQSLNAFAVSKIADKVSQGGAGCSHYGAQSASFLNAARSVRLSVDLRGENEDTLQAFEEAMEDAWKDLLARFQAEGRRERKQSLRPFSLSATGKVLQLERSYGGSPNPNEAQLADDLLCGTLLQLGTSWDYLREEASSRASIRELTLKRIPDKWIRRQKHFVSGALHDSANFVAASASRSRSPS